jgi:hypothetical protein
MTKLISQKKKDQGLRQGGVYLKKVLTSTHHTTHNHTTASHHTKHTTHPVERL